ncbi:MAG: acetyl-CoA carboxylase biotin carboxyl carrier protein subunit [Bacteroidetes bacterium]|jgi:glutaconyl-CoA/methylmalonyl-CoA decarboxylase subunit gamma|nr:acetyl-CoA carboxylase biotin carboxyl carrier protein subunit [Bacteroidota bacterium]
MNSLNKELIALNKESNAEQRFSTDGQGKIQHSVWDNDLHFETDEDGFNFISTGDLRYPVEIVSHHQNDYELLMNGVSYNFSVETPFSIRRKKLLATQASESTSIRLKAPMPGKILEVMVRTGDSVKAGDTLLILEAMKMQNAILASTKGVIKKVHVKEGDTTSKSDLLIELEKEA